MCDADLQKNWLEGDAYVCSNDQNKLNCCNKTFNKLNVAGWFGSTNGFAVPFESIPSGGNRGPGSNDLGYDTIIVHAAYSQTVPGYNTIAWDLQDIQVSPDLGLFPTSYIENGPFNWDQVVGSGAEPFKQKINHFKNKSPNNKVLLSLANGGR